MKVRRHRISKLELKLFRFPVDLALQDVGFDLSKSYIRWYDEGAMVYVYEQRVDDAP